MSENVPGRQTMLTAFSFYSQNMKAAKLFRYETPTKISVLTKLFFTFIFIPF